VKLPRTPGRKDSEYMHLFSGAVDLEQYANAVQATVASATSARSSMAELEQRLSDLEAEVARLRQRLE
jgi:uncharacterized protein YceH (UPF0502 family)